MTRSASTPPVFGMNLNALLLIGSIRSLSDGPRMFIPPNKEALGARK